MSNDLVPGLSVLFSHADSVLFVVVLKKEKKKQKLIVKACTAVSVLSGQGHLFPLV